MPTLDEVASDVQIVFWGTWPTAPDGLMVQSPDPENLCFWCVQQIGSRGAGASVRADNDLWLHYHHTCWYEAVDDWKARDTVEHGLDASLESEDLERW